MQPKYKIWFAVPGMPVNGQVMEHASLGGSESAGAYLAAALAARGHDVTVFANIQQPDLWRGVKFEPLGQPSQQAPIGQNFLARCQVEPCDLLVVQRAPNAFGFIGQAKVKMLWMHDLARVRYRQAFKGNAWNCQGILAVSEWHRKQINDVYAVPPEYVHVIRNGIDPSLYSAEPDVGLKLRGKRLLYTSRPERGLENLVKPDGVMAKLADIDPEITLVVCTYDNAAPELRGLYQQLAAWAQALPNVELLPAQNKKQLAQLMYGAALWVYPTVPAAQHEETSCIGVMECQAAGTPFVVCAGGAVPETVGEGAAARGALVPYLPDGSVDIAAFVEHITAQLHPSASDAYMGSSTAARAHALSQYTYLTPAAQLESLLGRTLGEASSNPVRLVTHLYESAELIGAMRVPVENPTAYISEQQRLTAFLADDAAYAAHYARSAQLFHQYVPQLATKWNIAAPPSAPEKQQVLASMLRELQRGPARVLDYGCGVGEILLHLAQKYPSSSFVGVDIGEQNVATANAQAELHGLRNVQFHRTTSPEQVPQTEFDLVICSETLEHMRQEPWEVTDGLEKLAAPGALILLTFPGSKPDHYVRAKGEEERLEHVRFIQHADAETIWGKKPQFGCSFFPISMNNFTMQPISGCIVGFRADHKPAGKVDYAVKLQQQFPRQTLGGLLICKGNDWAVEKTVRSISQICDRIVIGTDRSHGYDEQWWNGLRSRYPKVEEFALKAEPLIAGFDAARNEVLDRLDTDWVLWIDSDEVLCYGERILRYLQPNCFVAYGLAQHHLSVEPPGVLRTDWPCRVFRRGVGLRFYGVVHEHPCYNEVDPPAHVMMIGDGVGIEHPGYRTEAVRRERFQRNLPLMKRDREVYPNRPLGAYLWCRDLMHQARFEAEQNGGRMGEEGIRHCHEALALYRQYVDKGDAWLVMEMLPYATDATRMLTNNAGVNFRFAFDANAAGVQGMNWAIGGQQEVMGMLPSPEDVEKLLTALGKTKLAMFRESYQ